MQGRDPHTAAHADHPAQLLYLGGLPQRTEQHCQLIALLQSGKPLGGIAHSLKNDGDAALVKVGIGNCQRDALAIVLVYGKQDELPRLPFLRYMRSLHAHKINLRRKLFLVEYRIWFYGHKNSCAQKNKAIRKYNALDKKNT